jgi:hypothetical protein
MGSKDRKASFYSIGLTLILIGAAIVAFGGTGWLWNYFGGYNAVAFPSVKIIGGIVIIALGYIQLELDVIRRK